MGTVTLVAMLAAFASLATSVAAILLAVRGNGKPAHDHRIRHSTFARALRADVKEQSARIGDNFFHLLRTTPDSMETLRAHVRNLRNELCGPANYLDRMNSYPVADFPSDALSSAFGRWGGEVRALHKTVDDLHHELVYPLVNEPVVKQRLDYLLQQYQVEAEVLRRGVNAVQEAARKLDGLAAPLVRDDKDKRGSAASEH